jgi:hypothetical protein
VRVSLFALSSRQRVQSQGLDLRFAEGIQLRRFEQFGYAGRMDVRPGDVVPLLLEWQITRPVSGDYVISLQLLDGDGKLCAQQDGQAAGGFWPMSVWPAGEVVVDRRGLQIPEGLPAGEYQLVVAIYDWETLTRLPVRDAHGLVVNSIALLSTLPIGAP